MTSALSEMPLKLTDDFRLAAWRNDRAAIAQKERAQRLNIASHNREQRLEQFEIDKEQRLDANRHKRDVELAERESARQSELRARLVGLEDLSNFEDEFRRSRRTRQRSGLFRFGFFVGLPVLAVTYYMISIATPIFQATTIFAVSEMADTKPAIASAALTENLSFKVSHYLTSSDMMLLLQSKSAFLDQFSQAGTEQDIRQKIIAFFGVDSLSSYRSHVSASVNIQENILTLRVDGNSPEQAKLASQAILEMAELHFNQRSIDNSYTVSMNGSPQNPTGPRIQFETLSAPYSENMSWQRNIAKIVFATLILSTIIYSVLTVMLASFAHYSRN